MSEPEYDALRKWGVGRKIIEIGAYLGASTIEMAGVARLVVSIDPHIGVDAGTPPSWDDYMENLVAADARNVIPVHMFSHQASGLFNLYDFNMVFIDGEHTYEACQQDLRLWASPLQKGSFVLVHNYGQLREFPGVTRAVDESGIKKIEVIDTLWIGRR